jgi:hypothetical protein
MTKNKIFTVLAALTIVLFTGCKKDTTDNVSKVLKVPSIEIIGGNFISIPLGGTYTDAGATYTDEDGTQRTIQGTGTVSTAAPGVYFITYHQTSSSGLFDTEAVRVVGVGAYQTNPTDYSGAYLRAATGQTANVTRVAPGFYRVQNPGGAVGHDVVVVYFVETDLDTFQGPLQPNEYVGDIQITDISFTGTGATWRIINNPFYGTGVRTFVKQ